MRNRPLRLRHRTRVLDELLLHHCGPAPRVGAAPWRDATRLRPVCGLGLDRRGKPRGPRKRHLRRMRCAHPGRPSRRNRTCGNLLRVHPCRRLLRKEQGTVRPLRGRFRIEGRSAGPGIGLLLRRAPRCVPDASVPLATRLQGQVAADLALPASRHLLALLHWAAARVVADRSRPHRRHVCGFARARCLRPTAQAHGDCKLIPRFFASLDMSTPWHAAIG